FKTTSRECLVSNDWDILLTKFQALLDRGTVVFFDPPPEEIHAFVQRWFQDQEIYAFIGQHLDEIPRHSIRYYVIAQEHKRLGLDWQKSLLESWRNELVEIEPEKAVEMILGDPQYQTDKDRINVFTSRTGLQRRQWYYLKKKVMKRKPGLGYLPQPQPPTPVVADQDRNESEMRTDDRQKQMGNAGMYVFKNILGVVLRVPMPSGIGERQIAPGEEFSGGIYFMRYVKFGMATLVREIRSPGQAETGSTEGAG